MKIKALNYQTGSFQETVLTPETGELTKCLVGRHPNCDLILNAPEISRVHGVIFYHQGFYYFTDLASTDGSRINNQRVEVNQYYKLQPDDVVRVGDFVLLFEDMEISDRVLQDRESSQTGMTVRCVQVIEETPDVKTFQFIAEPGVAFSYQPGQFVTLDLTIDGKPIKRSYSISSSPSRPHSLEITVKRVVPSGFVSNWLHNNLTVNSQVQISPPLGDFTCIDRSESKLLFISAGSGITPMISMSRWLCDTSPDSDIIFIHTARTVRDIIFRQELELMASRHPNFKLAITLTGKETNQPWLGYRGRLNKSMIEAMAPDIRDRVIYLCGPAPFREEVKAILRELEFPIDENYYEESFGQSKHNKNLLPAAKPIQPSQKTVIEPLDRTNNVVVFAKSGREVTCDGGETILETAQKKGIELPYMCGMGVCRRCKLPLIEGKVHYDEDPKCEEGYVLTCIGQPVGKVTIGF